MNILEFVNMATRRLRNSINAIIGRGVVTQVDDTMKMQLCQLQLLADELRDKVENFQPYGFSYFPKTGAEAVVVFPQGNREHGIIIQVADRRYRLAGMAEGEVALYTDEGDKIHFKRNRITEIVTGQLNIIAAIGVQITSPAVAMSGTLAVAAGISGGGGVDGLQIDGPVVATGDVSSTSAATSLEAIKTAYNAHTHAENGSGGGVTDPPNTPI